MLCRNLTVAFCLAGPAALMAEQPKPMTGVALFKVTYGKSGEWLQLVKKIYEPALQKLLKDGVVLAYGIDEDILHTPGQPNADSWFTVTDYAAYQKVGAAIQEAGAKMPAELEKFRSLMDMEKHQDLLVKSVDFKSRSIPAGTLPFTSISSYKFKPGEAREAEKYFERFQKPVLDKLVDDGVIYGYSFDAQEFHTGDPAYRWLVINVPVLAALDKIDAAFEADDKKRSEEERSAINKTMMGFIDWSAHRDSLSRALAYAEK